MGRVESCQRYQHGTLIWDTCLRCSVAGRCYLGHHLFRTQDSNWPPVASGHTVFPCLLTKSHCCFLNLPDFAVVLGEELWQWLVNYWALSWVSVQCPNITQYHFQTDLAPYVLFHQKVLLGLSGLALGQFFLTVFTHQGLVIFRELFNYILSPLSVAHYIVLKFFLLKVLCTESMFILMQLMAEPILERAGLGILGYSSFTPQALWPTSYSLEIPTVSSPDSTTLHKFKYYLYFWSVGCKWEVPTTPLSGSINLLKWHTYWETGILTGYQFIIEDIKGYEVNRSS